jgi:hypothetical protein
VPGHRGLLPVHLDRAGDTKAGIVNQNWHIILTKNTCMNLNEIGARWLWPVIQGTLSGFTNSPRKVRHPCRAHSCRHLASVG